MEFTKEEKRWIFLLVQAALGRSDRKTSDCEDLLKKLIRWEKGE